MVADYYIRQLVWYAELQFDLVKRIYTFLKKATKQVGSCSVKSVWLLFLRHRPLFIIYIKNLFIHPIFHLFGVAEAMSLKFLQSLNRMAFLPQGSFSLYSYPLIFFWFTNLSLSTSKYFVVRYCAFVSVPKILR